MVECKREQQKKEREDKVIHFNLVEVSMEPKSWFHSLMVDGWQNQKQKNVQMEVANWVIVVVELKM